MCYGEIETGNERNTHHLQVSPQPQVTPHPQSDSAQVVSMIVLTSAVDTDPHLQGEQAHDPFDSMQPQSAHTTHSNLTSLAAISSYTAFRRDALSRSLGWSGFENRLFRIYIAA